VVGVGHSIGATLLLARAGADLWLGPEDRIAGVRDPRLSALVLLAPALGYFAAPGALDAVDLPLLLRVGSADAVTPPDDARRFVAALNGRISCDFAVVDGADHFSFMDQRPPGQPEPWADAATFRVQLAERIIALAH
jgi:predicted dienelactone hydrolase